MTPAPRRTLAVGVAALASLVFWVGQIVHAMRTARRGPKGLGSSWTRPLATVGVLAVAAVGSGVVIPAVRARVAQTVYIPAEWSR